MIQFSHRDLMGGPYFFEAIVTFVVALARV
jgi:hypothetical protein